MDNYLYNIKYSVDEESLCKLELKCIFEKEPVDKYIISNKKIDPSKSPFIKQRLSFIYEEDSFDDLINKIKSENLTYEDFKVSYVKGGDNIEYEKRLEIIKKIGMSINGEADIYNPKIEFGFIKLNNKWIFGKLKNHNNNWNIHDKKPCTYSNSLNYRLARSLINIAASNMENPKLVDPCCGVGTVLIEGVALGYNIKGYEINPMIGERAKTNLKFFDYEDVVTIGDMHNISEKFDASIIDIPYGLFNPITEEEQLNIIKTGRKISDKMIIISYEEMDNMINKAGFKILQKATINKGKFKRYIGICI